MVDQLHQDWLKRVEANVRNGSLTQFNHFMKKIIRTFDEIPLQEIKKTKSRCGRGNFSEIFADSE